MTGDMFTVPATADYTKVAIALDGSLDARSAPKGLMELGIAKAEPLSRPDPLLAQFVRAHHTHV